MYCIYVFTSIRYGSMQKKYPKNILFMQGHSWKSLTSLLMGHDDGFKVAQSLLFSKVGIFLGKSL